MQYRYLPQMRYPLERGNHPQWWPSEKESWWNEIKFSKDIGPPPNRKPMDLKKGLVILCFGSYENTCLLKFRKLRILLDILGVCKINSVLNKHLFVFFYNNYEERIARRVYPNLFSNFSK